MDTEVFVPTAEAAYIAGLSVPLLDRLYEARIFPPALVRDVDGRRYARLASALARFYVDTAHLYSDQVRGQAVTGLVKKVTELRNPEPWLALKVGDANADLFTLMLFEQVSTADLAPFIDAAALRAREVDAAHAAVKVDPDVMSGMPVFAGTRVPISVVTASLDKGIPLKEVAASYPFLTRELAEAARVYQLVHPSSERRRRMLEENPGWKRLEEQVVRGPRKRTAT